MSEAISNCADEHAIIITKTAAYTPSGMSITRTPVDTIDKLFKLIEYKQLRPAVMPPQIWVADDEACAALGWGVDPGDEEDYEADENGNLTAAGRAELKADVLARLDAATHQNLRHSLAPTDSGPGWHLFQPGKGDTPDPMGHHIRLTQISDAGRKYKIDIILASWMWTMKRVNNIDKDELGILGSAEENTLIDTADRDAPQRIAARIAWHVESLGVLPADTGARTGASIADKVYRDRKARGKGIVVTDAVKVPPIPLTDNADLEPPILFGRVMQDMEVEKDEEADRVVEIDQRAAHLASAGMVNLGYGGLDEVVGDEADVAARGEVLPFGVWHVTLPAAAELALPEYLPLPHPRMRTDRDVDTWITTESLRGLLAPVADGGAGLSVDDLGIDDAWLTPHQGQILKRWKEILAAPLNAAEENSHKAQKVMIREIYSGYIGRMANPELWPDGLQRHHQPLWRASIIAHVRQRSRSKAMKVAAEHGIWPLAGMTDAWSYLCPAGVDLTDELRYLGKFRVKNWAPLTNDVLLGLLSAEDPAAMRKTLATTYKAAKAERDAAREAAADVPAP